MITSLFTFSHLLTLNTEHPITPPPELILQWLEDGPEDGEFGISKHIATQAARWGADQELEACVNYVDNTISGNKARALRTARRPKPPSLKEQALAALNVIEDKMLGPTTEEKLIRRALESLPE